MNLPLGLVINFAGTRFGKAGISRVILKDANKPDLLKYGEKLNASAEGLNASR